jgi:hypothetical protein
MKIFKKFNYCGLKMFSKAKIVSQNFFGGFKERTEEEKKKNRKDWIEEMIMKSKQAKVGISVS